MPDAPSRPSAPTRGVGHRPPAARAAPGCQPLATRSSWTRSAGRVRARLTQVSLSLLEPILPPGSPAPLSWPRLALPTQRLLRIMEVLLPFLERRLSPWTVLRLAGALSPRAQRL